MKICPVIHASDEAQIFRNIERAVRCNVDGVFLINHAGIEVPDMLRSSIKVRKEYPNLFMGLNLLGAHPEDAFRTANDHGVDALWLDESHIRNNNRRDDLLAEMDVYRKTFRGKYFGSVAFKTHGTCSDPVAVAVKAVAHCDVVTTSGADTGKAPELEKIASMKAAIGDYPLAIASGITPENVHLFSMADYILVATGVAESWTEISTEKLTDLVKRSKSL